MEVERVRLLSLALDFGFEEEFAKQCLDRLIDLYGEDGKDFVTVEYCGDDFLAALADAMQDTEDWEDLEAIESEACGALSKIVEKKLLNDHEEETGSAFGSPVVRKEGSCSHAAKRTSNRLSSFVDDDSDVEVLSQNEGRSFNSNRKRGQSATQSGTTQPLISTVRFPCSFFVYLVTFTSFVFIV